MSKPEAGFDSRIQKAFMYLVFLGFSCVAILAASGTAYVVFLVLSNMREWR